MEGQRHLSGRQVGRMHWLLLAKERIVRLFTLLVWSSLLSEADKRCPRTVFAVKTRTGGRV